MILILEARRALIGLQRGLEAAGREVAIARDIDIGSMKAVRAEVARAKPAAVVLTGGLEDPLVCEEEPARAFLLNGEGAIHLAAAALEFRAVPIMISTAAVFGDRGGEYGESDQTEPQTAYAKSKLQGETFLLRAARNGIVLRVGTVIEDGHARAERVSASDREIVSVVGAYDLGIAIDRCLAGGIAGVVHAANGNVSEAELAQAIAAQVEVTLRKGGAALLCSRIAALRPWREAVEDAMCTSPPVVPVRTLAPGEAVSGSGPVEVTIVSGKVVIEETEDLIAKAGASVAVTGPYRVVAIDPSQIIVR